MSRSADQAQTPANSVVWNIAGKGSKQATDDDSEYLPEDKLRDICEKHYNQILPIMMEKSELCNRRRRPKKKKPSPATALRDTRPSQNTSVFSRLRREGDKPTRRRSPVSTTVFTMLGHRDGNVFTRLRERRKNVHSRLGPEVAAQRRHASKRRNASSNRSAEDPNRRKKDARSLIRSYVTCSSERQSDIEEEWYAVDRANCRQLAWTKEAYLSEDENDQGGHWKSRPKKRRSYGEDDLSQPWLCEETDPFTARIRYFKAAAKIERWAMPTWCHMFNSTLIGSARVWFDKLPPESIDNYEMLRKAFLGNFSQQKKYIKDPIEIHHIKQRERESTEAFMERRNDERDNILSKGEVAAAANHTDECIHLRRQVEEAVRSGQFPHLVKEIKQGGKRGEYTKATKKGETPNKVKATEIFMVQLWQRMTKQKTTQSFSAGREISFSPIEGSGRQENLILIKAEVEGNLIHHIYVDGGSTSEVLYKHCIKKKFPEIKNQMIPAITSLLGFSGEISWPLGQISLIVSLGDGEHSISTSINFMVVRSPSPYKSIISRPGLRKIQAVPSTAHGMLKFPVEEGIVTIRIKTIILAECRMVAGAPNKEPTATEGIKVEIHPEYPKQTVTIGGSLSEKGKMEICNLLKDNLDIFAWKPTDMTGVPRSIAEHRLNIHEGCQPIRQKRRGHAPDRNNAIQEEVSKLWKLKS
ncbi:reverse transcriptase domain-containing protein [Tanacetum coccineum]